MKKYLLCILVILPFGAFSQVLTNSSNLTISKSWSQEPSGYTFPVGIRVPPGNVPPGGFPVCILLHGNGGNGMGMITQLGTVLECHILVAPTGYQNTWNICSEPSDAPDGELISDLVDLLKGYSNIDTSRIRILGTSNGGGLANRVFIENPDPGIDLVCAIVTQLHEPQYHSGGFYKPSAMTNPSSAFCGYDIPTSPLPTRKYLSVCNINDPIIPYNGGTSVVGVDFLPAEQAVYIIAQNQGYQGSQVTTGTSFGNPAVSEFSYMAGKVVHLSSNAGHATNVTQRDYISDFFSDCSLPVGFESNDVNELLISPNPVTTHLSVNRTTSVEVTYALLSPSGRVLLTGTCSSSSLNIDLSRLSSNVYFLKIGNRVIRVVKQ